MRTVFPNRQVAHVWAQQNQSEGRSGNGQFYFRDSTIFSYRDSFPIAKFVTRGARRAVLFTTRTYSITTTRHCSMARNALHNVDVIRCEDPLSTDHKAQHALFVAELESAVLTAARSRGAGAGRRMRAAQDCADNANRYAEFFGLRWRLRRPEFTPEFVAEAKAKAAADAARKAKTTRLAAEKAKAEAIASLARWRQGEHVSLHGLDFIALRVQGDQIRTSRGAEFPLEHGKKAFAFIAECRKNGQEFRRNGHSIHLGHFQIDAIAADGTVTAGCHTVPWAEIERLALQLGLAG